jgi:hypothetical protein
MGSAMHATCRPPCTHAASPRSTYTRVPPPADQQRGRGKSERDEEGKREGDGESCTCPTIVAFHWIWPPSVGSGPIHQIWPPSVGFHRIKPAGCKMLAIREASPQDLAALRRRVRSGHRRAGRRWPWAASVTRAFGPPQKLSPCHGSHHGHASLSP